MGGNQESERAVVDEVLVHDGAEEMMERIGGQGSDVRQNPVTVSPHVFVILFLPVDPFYIH